MHEFDLRDHILDGMQAVSMPERGKDLAADVRYWSKLSKNALPENLSYLGLAAGCAFAELELARTLDIKGENITLLDKQFPHETVARCAKFAPSMKIIHSGLFSFLLKPPERKYHLVTAFGIEYLFDEPGRCELFISAIRQFVTFPGIVHISPYDSALPEEGWFTAGFQPFSPFPNSPGRYVLAPES